MIHHQKTARRITRVDLVAAPPTATADRGWLLEGAIKDAQSITADWVQVNQPLIEGVRVKEIKNVAKEAGRLTEVYRADWRLDEEGVAQVFQCAMSPGALSAWHVHAVTIDRLFASDGLIKIVLYDGRHDSPTYGLVNEFRFGAVRPGLVVVPPQVWHGVKNIGAEPALLINLVDKAYCYEDPDSWRLPADTPLIPYSFGKAHAARPAA